MKKKKSKGDSTKDEYDTSWSVCVTNTLTKSYDSWDEVDENNNVINKGVEINILTDAKISNGYRHNDCSIF